MQGVQEKWGTKERKVNVSINYGEYCGAEDGNTCSLPVLGHYP